MESVDGWTASTRPTPRVDTSQLLCSGMDGTSGHCVEQSGSDTKRNWTVCSPSAMRMVEDDTWTGIWHPESWGGGGDGVM